MQGLFISPKEHVSFLPLEDISTKPVYLPICDNKSWQQPRISLLGVGQDLEQTSMPKIPGAEEREDLPDSLKKVESTK